MLMEEYFYNVCKNYICDYDSVSSKMYENPTLLCSCPASPFHVPLSSFPPHFMSGGGTNVNLENTNVYFF